MPELPEVETIKNGLLPHLKNKTIINIIVRQSQLRWPIPVTSLKKYLPNSKITSIDRRAKYLILTITKATKNRRYLLIIHLGMSGSLILADQNNLIKKHDHVDIVLNNNKILRYNDPRRFGAILWLEPESTLNVYKKNEQYLSYLAHHIRFKHLGPEPLSDIFNGTYLYNIIKNSRSHSLTPIKNFIMDNKVVVGVGNIYATESLFKAKISPLRPISKTTEKELKTLAEQIKLVLTKAIQSGGTTLKDFVNSEGKPGYFKQELSVYGRTGKKCMNCSSIIINIKQQGRTTAYCSTCQI